MAAIELDEEPQRESMVPPAACLFPPALIPIVRERLPGSYVSLLGVTDEVLLELLTVVFFAALEPHESAHYPVRVAFAGLVAGDVVMSDAPAPEATPMLLYRWSTLRIEPDRPFCVAELVKLGVVTRSERMYTKVELTDRGLRIVGISREGVNREGDPYLKVVAMRPGVLSIRRGHEGLVDYEHGRVAPSPVDVVMTPGIVRRALETAARNANLGAASFDDYLTTVRAVVRKMSSHCKGGILIVSPDTRPESPPRASYRIQNDSTIAQLLHYLDGAASARRRSSPPAASSAGSPAVQLRRVLRGAFLSEAERWVSEFGAFTAMDGATILDCALGLRGFGAVLVVARNVEVVQADDPEATTVQRYDLSTRGARHRAAVTYAKRFPGSVVFIASQDGPVSCLVCEPGTDRVILWPLASGEFH